jgi:hypothetical protein
VDTHDLVLGGALYGEEVAGGFTDVVGVAVFEAGLAA